MLQIKKAQASVLEGGRRRLGLRRSGRTGRGGQRIMQAASDLFLGWTHTDDTRHHRSAVSGRQFYVRRLTDARLAALGTQIEQHGLQDYAALCGRTLGRAYGRSAELARLAGYLGHGWAFAHAVADFAILYAYQTERDWRAFKQAVEDQRLSCDIQGAGR